MKKILLIILILLSLYFNIGITYNLSVKSNLKSGEYNFPIEINLISNNKDAKIFFYTDGEGRIDNIKEFKHPILLKEDTTINFYAITNNFEDTLIQTEKYIFKYSEKIDIQEKDGKIIIKNNSNDIQNIGYWKIEADNLNYEINPNTFIEINEFYKIDYKLKDLEKVVLYSPDNKIIKNFIYKKQKELKKIQEKNELINSTVLGINSNDKQLKIQTNSGINIKTGEIIDNIGLENIQLNDYLKTSIINNKTINNNETKDSKLNNLYIILLILILITLYNIGLFLVKSEKFIKNKKNK